MSSPLGIIELSGKESDAGRDFHAQANTLGESRSNSPTTPRSPLSGASATTSGSTKGLLGAFKWNRHSGSSGPRDQRGLTEDDLSAHNFNNSLEGPLDDGWPLLARAMEMYPEFEAFSRFRELHAKNLLYYQVELDFLKGKLEFWERFDAENQRLLGDTKGFSKCADKMVEKVFDGGKCKQWDLVIKLRETLHSYDNAILQYAKISALPEPGKRNIQELRNWIVSPHGGNYTISGNGTRVWGALYSPNGLPDLLSFKSLFKRLRKGLLSMLPFWRPEESDDNHKDQASRIQADLVALHPMQKVNAMEGWIAYSFLPWMNDFITCIVALQRYFYRLKAACEETLPSFATPPTTGTRLERGREEESGKKKKNKKGRKKGFQGNPKLKGIAVVSVATVIKATTLVSTIVACIVPTMAIAVLTTTAADSKVQKLMWIGGFTTLFALGLTAFAGGVSRVQVFMAAAAFSAVLVVFIQN